ncbi:unnamed protein product [Durusdinium trenchii]|uniref:Uncharacterized protein n=2 Tax=Durusdinium trenchii TaxID=1381693 RepID=A0ABP0KG49_9DINO
MPMSCSMLLRLAAFLGGLQVIQSFVYDEKAAEKYIWLEQLTLIPKDELQTMRCGLTCEMLPEVTQVHVTRDAYPLDTRGLVLRYGTDDCAVVFRGSKSVLNYLLADFDVLQGNPFSSCPGCKIHRGFYKSWKSLEAQTIQALKDLECEASPLRISGHSLGGSMAMLAAFELSKNYTIKEVYTFGQPRVGNDDWVQAFQKRMVNVPYFRVVDFMDPVPHLPPSWLFGYRHAGPEVWYNATQLKHWRICSDAEKDQCSGQFPLWRCLFHTCDHCSYLGMNPCNANDAQPACMQGDLN